ncbi:MAG TPA: NAD(P)H-dependent glycerol-3-phosphate dehydrogenase [bacterium]|nr:NAD(P)H-dependent glycerol-3-phosphate dehydrogenase [bacterium]
MAALLVLGGGSWGVTLARLLAGRGHTVQLWEYDPALRAALRTTRANPRCLPGVLLPPAVAVIDGPEEVATVAGALMVVPSTAVRATAARFCAPLAAADWTVSAAKGLDGNSLLRLSAVIAAAADCDPARVGALSGPSHAEEVSAGIPTSVTVAFPGLALARTVRDLLTTPRFRIYANDDLPGVELGGALKNVIAIATGISDGLGFGDNTRAALITRGLREMERLGVAQGARAETFAGLSGLGDLVVTCTSRHSRNRQLGEYVGRGDTLAQALARMTMVAEGVPTCSAAQALARQLGLRMPITDEVCRILHEGQPARAAVENLMGRQPTDE